MNVRLKTYSNCLKKLRNLVLDNKKPHLKSEVEVVKVKDLLYKNEIDIIIHKVIKVSLNGDSVINSTKNKVIYC